MEKLHFNFTKSVNLDLVLLDDDVIIGDFNHGVSVFINHCVSGTGRFHVGEMPHCFISKQGSDHLDEFSRYIP